MLGKLGCIPGEYHINVDPNVNTVVHPTRRVPFARDKLNTEFNRMVSLGVIEKVDKRTDWVNSIVIVEKSNGDIRICLDPKDLNLVLRNLRFFSSGPGSGLFTVLTAALNSGSGCFTAQMSVSG